jgi:competence protein ComFB
MIVNVMERHAAEAYDRLKGKVPGFLDSPDQRADVIVHALNRLPPRYVVTNEGKAITEVALGGDQQRTAIEVKIVEAMQMVTQRPRVPA